jgi:hypothetical protein
VDVKTIDERAGQFRDEEERIRLKFHALSPLLDERQLRLWLGAEALALGPGGIAAVARATKQGRERISAGFHELSDLDVPSPEGRPQDHPIRQAGGGRKPLRDTDPTVIQDLDSLVHPTTRGDPESPLRWTTKSLRHLAQELYELGHSISPSTVGKLLHEMGYSLQANKKTVEGTQHPDRNAQFEFINAKTAEFLNRNLPVISVDTKKKELVGNFKNSGQEWQPEGAPVRVDTHDFPEDGLGKAIPYGVYDIGRDEGWVSVGTDHDTPQFAVAAITAWWNAMGKKSYPDAKEVLITADAGGSNGYRARLWKLELQRFADATGLKVHVSHFPPATSKWNRIEHSLFSEISLNWRGRPLVNYETIVNLIGATTTSTGLHVRARLDRRAYPTAIRVSAEQFKTIQLTGDEFHGEWNYAVGSVQ